MTANDLRNQWFKIECSIIALYENATKLMQEHFNDGGEDCISAMNAKLKCLQLLNCLNGINNNN